MANPSDPFAVPDPYGTTTPTALTSTDPYSIDASAIGAYELQAQALNQASLATYGSPMNPQALLDTLRSGASNSVLGAINDPTQSTDYSYMLSASPAGLQPNTNLVQSATTSLNLSTPQSQQLYSWDAGMTKNPLATAAANSDDPDINNLGELPPMNLGYVADVRAGKDSNRSKQWQQFLINKGFLPHGFGVSGQWDKTTDNAYVQFMAALYMPEALFGQNKPLAKAFLNELGYNVDAIIQKTGRDGLQKDAFLAWLGTQDHNKARDALQSYVSRYGNDSIPSQYQQLTGGWFSGIQDTLAGIPLLGHVVSPVLNIFNAGAMHSPLDIFEDNRDLRAQGETRGLTGQDLEAVQSVVNQAQHSVGWFGVLDSWDRFRNRVILGVLWDFHDHGLDITKYHFGQYGLSPVSNPYDSSTDWARHVSVGQNDLFDNVPWGASWFQSHSTSTAILNFTANMLDDPLTYTGVGALAKVGGKGLLALHDTGAALPLTRELTGLTDKAFTPWTTNDLFLNDFARAPIQHTLNLVANQVDKPIVLSNPMLKLQAGAKLLLRMQATKIITNNRNLQALDEMAHVVQKANVLPTDVAKLLKADLDSPEVATMIQAIKSATSHDQAVQLIANYFGDGMADSSFAYAYHSALRGISPTIAHRLSAGKINRILAHGSATLTSSMVDLRKPLRAADRLVELGQAVGMKDTTIRDFAKAMSEAKDESERGEVLDAFNEAIRESFNANPKWAAIDINGQKGYDAFQEWQRSARLVPLDDVAATGGKAGTVFAPTVQKVGDDGRRIQEASLAPASASMARVWSNQKLTRIMDETTRSAMLMLRDVVKPEDLDLLTKEINEQTLPNAIKFIQAKMDGTVNPGDRNYLKQLLGHLETENSKTSRLRDELLQNTKDGPLRGAPRDTSQLQYIGTLHATPAEILSFTNPTLRRLESTQRRLHADSARSFWSQIEIARPSSAIRITLGDEVSRFFFQLFMNGHPIPALRYLGKEMAALPMKGVVRPTARLVTGRTLNKKSFDDPRLSGDLLNAGYAGRMGSGAPAIHHVGSPHYDRAVAKSLLHTLGNGDLSNGWLDEYMKHSDISDELRAAQTKWYRDPTAANQHLDNAERMLTERGMTPSVDAVRHAREQAGKPKEFEGNPPDFARLDNKVPDSIAGELRAAGATKTVTLLNKVLSDRQDADVAKLEKALKTASASGPLAGKNLWERFSRELERARAQQAVDMKPLSFAAAGEHPDVFESLGAFQREPAIQQMHRLILATPQRMDQYRLLSEAYKKGGSVNAMLRPIEKEWTDAGATNLDRARAIDAFVRKYDRPEFFSQINELRQANRLYDLGHRDPWTVRMGKQFSDQHQTMADAIQAALDSPTRSDETLRELNLQLREMAPNEIGLWTQRNMEQAARNQLAISKNVIAQAKKDPNYFGYMSARQWAENQHEFLANVVYAHPQMVKWSRQIQKRPPAPHAAMSAGERKAAEEARLAWEKKWYQGFLKDFNPIWKKEQFDPEHTLFPPILQPVRSAESLGGVRGWTQDRLSQFHHNVTGAMVTHARGMGFETLREQRLASLRMAHPEWFDEAGRPLQEAQWRANSYAYAWLEKNTYQGQRTVMAGVMRNAFPFWGATANMSKFWLRQIGEHKHWQAPFLHTLDSIDQTEASGGVHLTIPVISSMMGRISGSQGDEATFDPLSPFFFTSDGIGGFAPGFGPYLSLGVDMMASHDPALVDAMMGAFGPLGDVWKQHINNTVDNPLLSWVPGVAQGAYQIATGSNLGHIPFVTQTDEAQNKDVLNRIQEQQGQRDTTGEVAPGPGQAQADATRSVGVDDLAKGVLNFLFPGGMKTADVKGAGIQQLEKTWDVADQKGKDQILGQEFGLDPTTIDKAISRGDVPSWVQQNPQNPANLLLYFDRRVSEDDKQSIANYAPWVVAYSTSKYDQQGQVNLISSAQEFGQKIADGSIDLLSPQAFLGQIAKNREYNQAASQYALLKQNEMEWFAETGNSTNSQAAKDYRDHFFYPQFFALTNQYQDWANQFVSQSRKDLQGLLVSTRPLRSLMNWEVIPQFDEMNNAKSNLWRQTFVDMNDAVTSIKDLRAAGSGASTTAAVQAVMQEFQQRLQAYAQQDPGYAAELDQFHFGRLEDLINMDVEGSNVAA